MNLAEAKEIKKDNFVKIYDSPITFSIGRCLEDVAINESGISGQFFVYSRQPDGTLKGSEIHIDKSDQWNLISPICLTVNILRIFHFYAQDEDNKCLEKNDENIRYFMKAENEEKTKWTFMVEERNNVNFTCHHISYLHSFQNVINAHLDYNYSDENFIRYLLNN